MKTKLVMALVIVALAAAVGMGYARRCAETSRAEVAKGYRGLVMEFPKKQLSWIKKGDSIDVISVFEALMKGDRREKIAATILQNVRVAGVNPRKGTIVLMLNPNEAQYAALAGMQGEIRFSLRQPGDSEVAQIEIASYQKIIR